MKKEWNILLLILGAPLWLPLLIAAVAIMFSLYAVLWSAVGSLWAVFGALAGCVLGGIFAGVLFMVLDNLLAGLAMVSMALICAGLAVFLFFGCFEATKGMVLLTKWIISVIKNQFVKREEA